MINPKLEQSVMKALLWLCIVLSTAVLVLILWNVLSHGIPVLNTTFFTESPRAMGREGGIYSTIVSTLYLVVLALAIAAPLGVGAAVFLVQYKKQDALLSVIRFATESLAGIPSVIFGIFGFTFFVIYLKMGWSILSGGLTLALMIFPIIVRTSEEAIKAVPDSVREASMALGATRWQTTSLIVLPSALPGILTGIVLSIGRAVGESAAVLLTAGSALGVPLSLLDPGRSMSVHLYVLATEGISMERAYATGSVLVIVVMLVNLLANSLTAKRKPL